MANKTFIKSTKVAKKAAAKQVAAEGLSMPSKAKPESPSKLIDARIKELPDWRGEVLSRIRRLIKEADHEVVEEVKWRKPSNSMLGVPVWSHDGLICTGETYKDKVKLTFAKGASLKDPAGLFNASLEGNARRAIDLREGDEIDERAFKSLVRAAAALNASSRRMPSKAKPKGTASKGERSTAHQAPTTKARTMDTQFWDDRYRSREQLFSGTPNGVLVTEVTDLPPGQALDVGCGEGADALWLARRGWQVTAVDISRVALQRAATTGTDLAGRVAWTCADLTTTPPPAGAFDLVSAQYFPLPHQPDHTALRGLLDAVAPGGTLLIASHDPADLSSRQEHGFDPSDYYQPDDIARLLDHNWTVLINETRPRTAPAPAGTHHTHDTVLRAQRLRNAAPHDTTPVTPAS